MTRVIAICGMMRSGKDTVAQYIVENHGYKHVKIADVLKKSLSILFNFTPEQLETDAKDAIDPHWGISPRRAMQFFGTEVMQYKVQELLPDCGRNFWIRSLVMSMKLDASSSYVISDLRFVHEYEHLRKEFPTLSVIKVERSICNFQDNKLHVSEQEHKNIKEDFKVFNDGSYIDLHKQLDVIMNTNQKL